MTLNLSLIIAQLSKKKKKFSIRVYGFVYPFLLFWAVVYPFTCIIYLWIHRKQLNLITIQAKMGFYINGYKQQFYFW